MGSNEKSSDSWKVYVLQLEDGKYYVGKTQRPVSERMDEHRNGHGAAWTQLHAVTGLVDATETSNPHQEDNVTLDYMKRYGVDNVRGGPYSKVNLTRDEINGIERRIRHNADACFGCGSTNHFANQCSGDPTEDERRMRRRRRRMILLQLSAHGAVGPAIATINVMPLHMKMNETLTSKNILEVILHPISPKILPKMRTKRRRRRILS
jgi:predicted GIY-YIG superfamily endonuclease